MSSTPAQNYVVGFTFPHSSPDRVYLIRKKRPDWQAGKLNGIGGKIEPGESSCEAMVREYKEEAGLYIKPDRWHRFAILDSVRPSGQVTARIHFFKASLEMGENPLAQTDEHIELCQTLPLPRDVIPNLRFMVPMARHEDLHFAFPAAIWERAF